MRNKFTFVVDDIAASIPKSQLTGYNVDVMFFPTGKMTDTYNEKKVIIGSGDEVMMCMKKDQIIKLRDILNESLKILNENTLNFGNFIIEESNTSSSGHQLRHIPSGTINGLTPKEYHILASLAECPNEPVKAKDIMMRGWGDDSYFINRSMQAIITKLRKHFICEPSVRIANIHGHGFRLQIQ